MTIYYRGPDVFITHEVFEVRNPTVQRYPVDALRDVHIVQSGGDPVALTTVHVAGGALVLVAVAWPFRHAPAAWLVVLALTSIVFVVGWAACRLVPRHYELQATYRDYPVRLFHSRDARTFGQVARALNRALEGSRERQELL